MESYADILPYVEMPEIPFKKMNALLAQIDRRVLTIDLHNRWILIVENFLITEQFIRLRVCLKSVHWDSDSLHNSRLHFHFKIYSLKDISNIRYSNQKMITLVNGLIEGRICTESSLVLSRS
jgi:hypothetical protein